MNWTPEEYKLLKAKEYAKKKEKAQEESYEREADLQKACQDYCDDNNIYWVHFKKSKGERKGIPDLLMCVDGEFFAAELKIGKNKMSTDQARQAFLIKKSGGNFQEIRSLRAFIRFLEKKQKNT